MGQFTMLFTVPTLVAAVTSIPGGALGDRFGIRLIVGIAAVLAGVLGLARAFLPNYPGMLTMMVLFGISFGFVIPNLPKMVGIWFPPRQVGLASGIYMTGLGMGTALGLLTGPMFGGWKPAFTYMGILMLAVSFLWIFLARSAPKGVKIEMPPLIDGIKKGVKSKNIWLVSLANFLLLGGFIALSGNIPHALESVHDISPQSAGAIASLVTWGFVVGNFFIPIASDRVGLRKPFLYGSALIAGVVFYLAWMLAPGAATTVLLFIGGLFLGGVVSLLMTLPVEFPEIGHQYIGGAAGVAAAWMNLGGFILPILVITPLVATGTQGDYNNAFLAAGIIVAAIAVPALFLQETGSKARK